eukprot:gb/GFBE01056290.1/.p1 GENE.gb/GFBE01056290.1/~~gb/GFBE01056290.1/.p1  ORF type:complete len:251 (+),score=42.05 gb/GFBE01056290.1/:1-753(+)
MLQLKKNQLVTKVSTGQIEIRQMEMDWYCSNYDTMTGQAAMLAGFAFSFITAPMPEGKLEPHIVLEFIYFFLVCTTIGLELGVIVLSSYLSVWAPSLALRGKRGTADLHKACDALKDYQALVFYSFMAGWVLYFVASILQVWIYYRVQIAGFVTIPLLGFIIAIIWYLYSLTSKLHLRADQVVAGKIEHFQPYEFIGDLDDGLHTDDMVTARAAGKTSGRADFATIHKDALGDFKPKLGVSGRSTASNGV